jgi:hypothetical protein
MIAAQQMDAMEGILVACGGQIQPPTLLKGISVRGQFYPEPHLRPMRDIDFLVTQDAVPIVESALHQMGYRRRSKNPAEYYETHHHTTPFFHPQTQVWVEVHRGLFPISGLVGSDRVFSADSVSAERRSGEFRGRSVYRLSDEFQIVYLASHWASDFGRVGGIVAMLDMIYLLKNVPGIRWNRILQWLDGGVVAASVYLLLTYLTRHGLIDLPPAVLREISQRQRSFGRVTLGIVHATLDRYVTDGREFGLLMSERNFEILWDTLLLPRAPTRRLPLLFWSLVPSRVWFTRCVTGYKKSTATPDTR